MMSTLFRTNHLLLRLPNDTLVDQIFPYLSVRDIIRIRKVCKLFYELTHQPMVWKRILRQFPLWLPPLPPSSRHSFSSLSSLETERLIVRALSLDANWCSPAPKVYNIERINVFYEVVHMKLLPGGRHMVASVRDAGPNSYALLLYMLDHRVKRMWPMARIRTESKAYFLEAKYMRCKGQLGVTIAYVRREPKHSSDRRAGVNVSEYSEEHDIDYPVDVRYESVVLHVNLDAVDAMEDPRFPPGSDQHYATAESIDPPFECISVVRSRLPIDFLDLVEIAGVSYIFLAKRNREIIIKNLETKEVSRIVCQNIDSASLFSEEELVNWLLAGQPVPVTPRIRAIRVIPTEKTILIVSTWHHPLNDRTPLSIEKFKVPLDGQTQEKHADQALLYQFPDNRFVQFCISAPAFPSMHDRSVYKDVFPNAEPPPVSIYVLQGSPWHFFHVRIWPKRVTLGHDFVRLEPPAVPPNADVVNAQPSNEGTAPNVTADASKPPPPIKDTTWAYKLKSPYLRTCECGMSGNENRPHILPGNTRAFVWNTWMESRRINAPAGRLAAYTDLIRPPSASRFQWKEDAERRKAGEQERAWARQAAGVVLDDMRHFRAIELGDEMDELLNKGIDAIAYDESSGKVCFVPTGSKMSVYVLEFAQTPKEDADGNRLPLPVPDVDERFRRGTPMEL